MSFGAYFWGEESESGLTGEKREMHRSQAISNAGGALALHEAY
jgi:hypothetical protein